MTVASTDTLNNNWRVQHNSDGTCTLQQFVSGSWTSVLTNVPKDELRQLWRDLAQVGANGY